MEIVEESKLNEQKLVEQARESQEAFSQLYNQYFNRIYGFIYKRVSHSETAEDILSDTFMKAYKNLDKYEYQGVSFGAWLYRIASNLIIDHYRKEKKYSQVDIDEMPEIEDSNKTDDPMKQKETKREADLILEKLPEKEKKVLELKFYAELTNIEIADTLGISQTNVGVIIFRALKKCQSNTNLIEN